MAKMHSALSVRFALRSYHYRTNEPGHLCTIGPYVSAKKAATEYAAFVANIFDHLYSGEVYHWDKSIWQAKYEKAYRRSLKVFLAMGMK